MGKRSTTASSKSRNQFRIPSCPWYVFPDFTWEIDDVWDLGDATVARVRLRGHGLASDAPMEQQTWAVVKMARREAAWWGTFESEPDALEAAGTSG
jgi:hypothetical protein